jgi:outer membrane immunogenic protein
MKKIFLKTSAALTMALLLSLNAHAGAESGIYLGAGVGDTNIKGPLDGDDLEFDSTGYKVLLGYNFGVVPLIDLAVEGAYVNLGEESSRTTKFEQTSWNGFGLAGLSFGPVGLFGKAGFAAWDAQTTVGGIKFSDSGTDPVYGLGARLQFGSITARIEIEYYDQSNFDDVSMGSISLLYTF